MAFFVTLKNLGAFAAAANLQLFLRKTSDNLLLNAGGDTGSDPDSIGSFTWTVSEDRPAEQLLARIYEGSTETAANIVIDSVLNVGFTEIGQEAVELDSVTAGKIDNIQDAAGYLLAIQSGECANPQTSAEQYDITQFGINFRVVMAGQTSTGTRTAPTLSKP
jgi:hypothetical protein